MRRPHPLKIIYIYIYASKNDTEYCKHLSLTHTYWLQLLTRLVYSIIKWYIRSHNNDALKLRYATKLTRNALKLIYIYIYIFLQNLVGVNTCASKWGKKVVIDLLIVLVKNEKEDNLFLSSINLSNQEMQHISFPPV